MVYDYKRKSNQHNWSKLSMAKAIESVINRELGTKRASETYGVPRSTLQRRIRAYRINPDMELAVSKDLGRFQPVFSPEQELELVRYLKEQEARLHGLTRKELGILVYQLAEKNGIPHPFGNGQAGKNWFKGFMRRHIDLSLRKPEPTSAARAAGFNEIVVNNFYDLLQDILSKHQLTPDRIYNVDETGYSNVPKSQPRIIATKGRKQVGVWTAADRGQLVTVEICVSAAGTWLPPVFVFPRKRMNPKFLEGALPGSWGACEPTGWMTSDIFFRWFKWFVENVEPTEDRPVLLIFDGHATHTKNLDVIDYARKHSVILLCLPPHTTHRMQPIDVSLMKPVSQAYAEEIRQWGRKNPACSILPAIVCTLFCRAFLNSAKPETIKNGFKRSGICPFDREVFTERDFAPAETTNRPDSSDVDRNASLEVNNNVLENLNSTLSFLSIGDGVHSPENCDGSHIDKQRPSSFVIESEQEFNDLGPSTTAEVVQKKDASSKEISVRCLSSSSKQKPSADIDTSFLSDFVRNLVAQKATTVGSKSLSDNKSKTSNDPSPIEPTLDTASRVVHPEHLPFGESSMAHCLEISSSADNSPARKEKTEYSRLGRSQFTDSPIAHCSKTSPTTIKRRRLTLHRLESSSSSDYSPIQKRPKKIFQSIEDQTQSRKRRKTMVFATTPYDLNPLPKAQPHAKLRRRARGKTAVLTNSPYRNELVQSKFGKKKGTRVTAMTKKLHKSIDNEETNEDVACIFCDNLYSCSTEDWIQCMSCKNWAHNQCAGADDTTIYYTCDNCADNT